MCINRPLNLVPIVLTCLSVIAWNTPYCLGQPTNGGSGSIDRFDDRVPHNRPLSDYGLHRLRRGYYYIEDGYISAVPAQAVPAGNIQSQPSQRRSSSVASDRRRERRTDADYPVYDSVFRVRDTHVSRKKLFVPNLFG